MANIDDLKLRQDPAGVIVAVKAVPGSSRDRICGLYGDMLKVATSAAPEKGKANKAIAKTLAKALGLAGSSVEIISGPTNPRKEFLIKTMDADGLKQKLRELV